MAGKQWTAQSIIPALRQFSSGYAGKVLLALRVGTRAVSRDTKKGFQRRGLGRALWKGKLKRRKAGGVGSKGGTPSLIIKRLRPQYSRSQGIYWTGVELRGMAAIIEEGGRTKQHKITAYKGGKRTLAFQGRSGMVFPRSVMHPGSAVRRDAVAARALQKNRNSIGRDVDRALQKYGDKVIG